MIRKAVNLVQYFIPVELKQRIRYRRHLKNNVYINPYVEIQDAVLEPYVRLAYYAQVIRSKIGRYTSIGRNTKVNHAQIGRYCSVSWNVTIGATNHPFHTVSTHAFPYCAAIGFVGEDSLETAPAVIGHDVWIGANCVILPGVNVGHGAVIGAGAVVTKDLPAYAVAAGAPARVIRYRFSEALIKRLLRLQWWDLPDRLVKDHVALFQRELTAGVLDRLEELKQAYQMDCARGQD
jgi:acetyltransferase-like isoleucine patch superfamily enzyme